MKQETREYVVQKSKEMMEAFSCSKEAKAAAQAWLEAAGTEREKEATVKYVAELEADIMPLDQLIAFAQTEAGAGVFGGAEAAKGVAEHGRELKAAGKKYCDCPACAAVEAILEKKADMLN